MLENCCKATLDMEKASSDCLSMLVNGIVVHRISILLLACPCTSFEVEVVLLDLAHRRLTPAARMLLGDSLSHIRAGATSLQP
jgi:hypothetical protein